MRVFNKNQSKEFRLKGKRGKFKTVLLDKDFEPDVREQKSKEAKSAEEVVRTEDLNDRT